MTIKQAIQQASEELARAGITSARLDAELLLSYVLCRDRTWLFTHATDGLQAGSRLLFEHLVARRVLREPLQYITGVQEFRGLGFLVNPSVLIPRPETEILAERAAAELKTRQRPIVIDVCTGSGCIAISIAREFRDARVFASDRSEAALNVARENARRHAASVRFLEGDLFAPFEELDLQSRVDVITTNPPYIETKDLTSLQPEVRDFEPEMALIAGPQGIEFHERILHDAARFLKPAGVLIMEMGIGQSERLRSLAASTGLYAGPEIMQDLAGIDRVIVLQRK